MSKCCDKCWCWQGHLAERRDGRWKARCYFLCYAVPGDYWCGHFKLDNAQSLNSEDTVKHSFKVRDKNLTK